ncbi:MAG: hypothetical protein QXU98_07230 [Candidatus Parvarchaeota archaeon]
MLKDIYAEAKDRGIPRKVVKDLLREWKKEYVKPPRNLTGLIEGVCE